MINGRILLSDPKILSAVIALFGGPRKKKGAISPLVTATATANLSPEERAAVSFAWRALLADRPTTKGTDRTWPAIEKEIQ